MAREASILQGQHTAGQRRRRTATRGHLNTQLSWGQKSFNSQSFQDNGHEWEKPSHAVQTATLFGIKSLVYKDSHYGAKSLGSINLYLISQVVLFWLVCVNWQVQSICWCALSKIVSLFVACLSICFYFDLEMLRRKWFPPGKKQTMGTLVLDPLNTRESVGPVSSR